MSTCYISMDPRTVGPLELRLLPDLAILGGTRPVGASTAIFWTGRFVFSSIGDQSPMAAADVVGGKPPIPWLAAIAQSLFAAIFPSDCRICGSFLTNISDLPVCLECLSAMRPMEGSFCHVCGERLTKAEEVAFQGRDKTCSVCRKVKPSFVSASAYGSYDHSLRQLLHLFKYEKVRPASRHLGKMLAEVIARMESQFRAGQVIVVPVPLHTSKRRQRGFNQAEVIARAALKNFSNARRFKLESKVLLRRRFTESQIGLSQHQRRENLRGAFKIENAERLAGKEVLLIDDVFTTGTTVSECARALRRAGATRVFVVTVARTLRTNIHGIEGFAAIPAVIAV